MNNSPSPSKQYLDKTNNSQDIRKTGDDKPRSVPLFLQSVYSLIRNSITGCPEEPLTKEEIGSDAGKGNLVGIQTYMEPKDYLDEHLFYSKIESYILEAQKNGWINEKTILVFPEYIGTGLVLADKNNDLNNRTFIKALATNMFRPIGTTIKNVFRKKSVQMVQIYNHVFSELSKKFQVTLVAGSIVLPSPQVSEGILKIEPGPLYNVTVVYRPDGAPHEKVVKKVHLIPVEKIFTTPGDRKELPVFHTPAGELSVLICFDSCFPENYQQLKNQHVQIIVSPTFFPAPNFINTRWKGFHGMVPIDTEQKDLKQITYGEAWKKYGLGGRLKHAGAVYGMNVFFRGNFWNYTFDGGTIIARNEQVKMMSRINGASLTNFWLD